MQCVRELLFWGGNAFDPGHRDRAKPAGSGRISRVGRARTSFSVGRPRAPTPKHL